MLTFETERALVARAGEVLARRQVPDGTAAPATEHAEAAQ
jgi:hypothetical protein